MTDSGPFNLLSLVVAETAMGAWRLPGQSLPLQERAFGGLDRESLRFLDGLARHGGSPRRRLKPGTVLVRDYQGQRHTVTVVSDGFAARNAHISYRCSHCGNVATEAVGETVRLDDLIAPSTSKHSVIERAK